MSDMYTRILNIVQYAVQYFWNDYTIWNFQNYLQDIMNYRISEEMKTSKWCGAENEYEHGV